MHSFITDLDSSCALALAATASVNNAHLLRDFLHRYVTSRMFLKVSTVRQLSLDLPASSRLTLTQSMNFVMEFHIPYYVLRSSQTAANDPRGLRRYGHFMRLPTIPGTHGPQHVYIYESHISFLLAGFDEFFWTAYCMVDVYYGSSETAERHWSAGLDAPSRGALATEQPVRDPRGYFLRVLGERTRQVMKEWSNVVLRLEERLGPHVRRVS